MHNFLKLGIGPWAQFAACYKKHLLSTEEYCLAESGNQQKFHKVDMIATGAPLIVCLAKKMSSSIFCYTNSVMTIFPGVW